MILLIYKKKIEPDFSFSLKNIIGQPAATQSHRNSEKTFLPLIGIGVMYLSDKDWRGLVPMSLYVPAALLQKSTGISLFLK